jgi:hypothetical protein
LKKIITQISLQRARKSELPTIIVGSLGIIEKYIPADKKIDGFYSKLLEKYQQMYLLKQNPQKHPLTVEIKAQRLQRKKLIEAIVMQGTAVEKANVSSQRESALLILPLIEMHLASLRRKNQTTIHTGVIGFSSELKQNVELMTAAETIGIKVYANDLISVEDSIQSNMEIRNKSKSSRRIPWLQKVKVKEDVINAFQDLMYAIELARVENSEIDYLEMIAELNEFLVHFQAQMKSRITRNKSAAKKTKTVAMSTTTSATAV